MSDEPPPDRDVLGSLPRTRPARRSAKRDAPVKATSRAGKPKAGEPKPATPKASKPKPATPKPAAAPRKARAKLTPPASAAPRASGPPASGYAVPEPDPHPGSSDLLGAAAEAALEVARLGVRLGLRALGAVLERRPGAGDDADAP